VRILQVHNRYRSQAPSGENLVVEREAEGLRRAGHEVDQFLRSSDEIDETSNSAKVSASLRAFWSSDSFHGIRAAVRSTEADVVHVHNTFPLISPAVLYACEREGVPVVVTLHNFSLICPSGAVFRSGAVCHDCLERRLPWPALEHRCYRDSFLATLPRTGSMVVHGRGWRNLVSAYIFISHAQRETHQGHGFPPGRMFVKTNLIPPPVAPRGRSGEPQPRTHSVAYLGRLDEVKGLPFLMRAWEIFKSKSEQASLRLEIAGTGPLQADLARWANGRDDVECLGFLSAEECQAVMRRVRAVIIPSQWEEPFGLVAVEAMSLGTPALAANHGALPELVEPNVTGMLFDHLDPGALASVLRDVDTQPESYAAYGESARKAYLDRFDPADNMRQLVAIYEFARTHPIERKVARRPSS
jgi:glycosyltransferase involved in cell wall biosynthesis